MPILPGVPNVHFDFGAVDTLGGALAELEINRPILVTDEGLVAAGVFDKVTAAMPVGVDYSVFTGVHENPIIGDVEKGMEVYRTDGCDGVVAIGGGSSIDSGKAMSLLAGHPGKTLFDFSGQPQNITKSCVPLIAIPTTAGTGSEVSRGAGIHTDDHTGTLGLGSPYLQPNIAICDPDLTLTLPPFLTAGTGMDVVTHCVEGYMSKNVNPPAEAVALDGIRRVAAYIERAFKDGSDREARWHMLMAAMQGGMSILAGLGPIHAVGLALSEQGHHHGALVTAATPPVLRFFQGQEDKKLAYLAAAMGVGENGDAAQAVADLNARLELPNAVKNLGYEMKDVDHVTAAAVGSHFNHTSPKVPTEAEYKQLILETVG
ncbi:MAG: iron-containing alcohol dehydrogenase [Rhodospirillales bacterium]|nr:iron-containing alcohol dehydrogenase [Rhodospirillales bacterium]